MKVQGPRVPQQPPQETQATEQQPEIVCPVLRGMVNDGHLHVDAEGNAEISELKDIFEDLGFNRHLAHVAVVGNRPRHILGNLFSGTFNLNDLRGGLLDHSGDSMILRSGKFDPERFDTLISHSADGQRMTEADFAKAIETNKADDDGSWMGARISKVEFGILLEAFGTKGSDGVVGIGIEDLRNLYEHKQVPPNFRPTENTAPTNTMASLAGHARGLATGSQVGVAQAGLDSALEGDDLLSSGDTAVMGAGKGACPFMGATGAETSSQSTSEVTQLHNQLSNAQTNPAVDAAE